MTLPGDVQKGCSIFEQSVGSAMKDFKVGACLRPVSMFRGIVVLLSPVRTLAVPSV